MRLREPQQFLGNVKNFPPLKIYLAARYSRREELNGYKDILEKEGFIVTSRWLKGDHQISDEEMSDFDKQRAKAHFAEEDWEDLAAANVCINFTEEPRTTNSRGGRHVEFGAALAMGQLCFVVGPAENVFHLLEGVLRFSTFEEAMVNLRVHFAEGC